MVVERPKHVLQKIYFLSSQILEISCYRYKEMPFSFVFIKRNLEKGNFVRFEYNSKLVLVLYLFYLQLHCNLAILVESNGC